MDQIEQRELEAERRHQWMADVARALAEKGLRTDAADREASKFLRMRDEYRRLRERMAAE